MSSAIGRLQAALANVTNEVTVAAANLNFDFTLVKYEVPREYEPIGKMMSSSRKQKAENGPAHVTARRLAALFDGVCPPSPALVKAYGTRASEIAQQATDKQPKEHYSSIFAQYAGVDATSMWASATSSNAADGGAVNIHLLACLIASAFEESHAISIWSELVDKRRAEIATRVQNEEPVQFALAAAAAQAEIPRQQLAEWDSSARSWLQTADSVKTQEKKQYDQILDKIDITANPSKDLYENVTGVWKTATEAMNNLVLGFPQEVQDGATVIGLKAWHLFPDTHFFGGESGHVEFNDPLIPRTGILSLGCSGSSNSSSSGVRWSLSLAHLKFYGDAVKVDGLVKSDPSLMTVEEFHLVILGAIFRLWRIGPSDEPEAIRLLDILITTLPARPVRVPQDSCHRLLHTAIALYRLNRPESRKFLSLGRNRLQFGPRIADNPHPDVRGVPRDDDSIRPYFGLLNHRVLIQSIKTPGARVQALLGMCRKDRRFLCENGALIRYSDNRETKVILLASDENPIPNMHVPVSDAVCMTWQDPDKLKPMFSALGGYTAPVSVSELLKSTNRARERFHDFFSGFEGDTVRISPTEAFAEEVVSQVNHFTFAGNQYRLFFGYHGSAAIYVPLKTSYFSCAPSALSDEFLRTLSKDMLAPAEKLVSTMRNDELYRWLSSNEYALSYVRGVPGPIIDVGVLRDRCAFPHWENMTLERPDHQSLFRVFSALAYYLSPQHSEHNSHHSAELEGVCGLSYNDSIYVPTMYLQDPSKLARNKYDDNFRITRILGNIGLPGLVQFTPVAQPIMPPSDVSWRFVDEYTFDGNSVDYFGGTSMHLNLTEWADTISSMTTQGYRDAPSIRKESFVSIRYRGDWVSDVNLDVIRRPYVRLMPEQSPCDHQNNDPKPKAYMRAIRSWGELREVRSGVSVVQAHGNWLARLAVTAYLAERHNPRSEEFGFATITLVPDKVCWACVEPVGNTEFFIY